MNKPLPLVGTHEKPCRTCGKIIYRNGVNNMTWIRKAFCGKACQVKSVTTAAWKRKRWSDV